MIYTVTPVAPLLRECRLIDGCPCPDAPQVPRLSLRPGRAAIAVAAAVSLLAHLGAMAALAPNEAILIEGGAEAAPAALGSSFADFAAGSPATMPEATLPNTTPQETAQATQPEHAHSQQAPEAPLPDLAATAPSLGAPVLPQPDLFALIEQAPLAPSETTAPSANALSPAQQADIPPSAPARTATPLVAPARTATEIIEPTDNTPAVTARSLLPPARSKQRPRAEQRPAAPPQPQGNAPQNARRGADSAIAGHAASNAAPQQTQSTAGNAAASNYPGEVMRRLQRVRHGRNPARGRVMVAFTISANGGLASASVARSSGHSGLDRAALEHVRRAAPFPAPPTGAQSSFSYEYISR